MINDDGSDRPHATIKLKGKFKSRDIFINSILESVNQKKSFINDKIIETSEKNESENIINELKIEHSQNPTKSRNENMREIHRNFIDGMLLLT